MNKLKIIYMGTPEFSVEPLKKINEKYDVILVVTQPDKEVGRKHKITYSKVKEFAIKNNIEVYQPINIKKDYEYILSKKPDLIITCAYGQIIPSEILNYPKYGCINLHASLLPKYRGGAPIQRAIINGDKYSGITIMFMDKNMDSGDILYQEKLKIDDNDTSLSLFNKLSILASNMIIDFIPKLINNNYKRIKQDEDKVTYAFNISKEDEKLDFNNTSINIYNKIRGLYPEPACYAYLDNKRVKFYSSVISNNKINADAGKINNIYKNGIGIKTLDGEIIITELQIEGKKREKATDYINGIKNKNDLLNKSFK